MSGGAVLRMDECLAVKVSCRASVAADELTAGIAVRDQRDHVTLALHKGLSHQDGCFHWLEHAASFVVRAAVWGDGSEPRAPAVGDSDERCHLNFKRF